ncbi:MAG: bifunctional oligoribonuclease/PAP phosphatase NrnA [Endomicrobium sp.]|jgi:phosphoesterase RecJ-like protein|nr:bifunctional oligoribonuclease/PAP phosphatase NrnA [Endomicrobium sp.]
MSLFKSDINKISKISKIIKQSKIFFIAGHIKPDGDSIGSALALMSVLNRIGKEACVYSVDEIPKFVKFLKGSNKIKKTVKKTDKFDCAIILESVNFSRMGDIITPSQTKKIINIDHHLTYTDFGNVNYIVPSSSSTAELVLNIFEYMKIKLLKHEAECLYTGIITDTGRFQQVNTTPDSHVASAKLMEYGVDVNKVYKEIYENRSINILKLQGLALYGIKTILNNKVSYILLTKDMFKRTSTSEEDSEDIVNYTIRIDGVIVGCVFKEVDGKTTKVSLRSVRNFNLLKVVCEFGGGGHKNAAGCTINAGIKEAVRIVEDILGKKLK